MSSVHVLSTEETKAESNDHHCHRGGERVTLVRMDSRFKVTVPDCQVLHHLFRPAALVAVPDPLLTEADIVREENEHIELMSDVEQRRISTTTSTVVASHLESEAPKVVIETDKHEVIWWNMETLKIKAPNPCGEEALFDMTVVSTTKDGREVRFKSHINDHYLIVTSDKVDTERQSDPQFKFKLSPNKDDGIASTFILGTDSEDGNDPNFLYLKFQNANDKEWYYWYIDGEDVKIRKADATEMFNLFLAPCN